MECDIFPEQDLAADELPPEHETLLSRVMTLKSDFGTCAKQADLAELYARIERLEREDGKAPEQREQTISNPSITRHTDQPFRLSRRPRQQKQRAEARAGDRASAVSSDNTAVSDRAGGNARAGGSGKASRKEGGGTPAGGKQEPRTRQRKQEPRASRNRVQGSDSTDDSDGAGGRAPAGGSSRAGRSGVQGSFAHPCQEHLRLV